MNKPINKNIIYLVFGIIFFGMIPTISQPQNIEYFNPQTFSENNILEDSNFPLIISKNDNQDFFVRYNYKVGYIGGILPYNVIHFHENWIKDYNSISNVIAKKKISEIGRSLKGDYIFYINRKINPNKAIKFRGIFYIEKIRGVWSDLKMLSFKGINSSKIHSFFISSKFNFIIFSYEGNDTFGKEDLYISLFNDGKWADPINMGSTINTDKSEICPYFDENKNLLCFSSNGHPGEGQYDIFYSEKLYPSSWEVWSKPENFGKNINTKKNEVFYSKIDEKIATFISDKTGFGDIYVLKKHYNFFNYFNKIYLNLINNLTLNEIFGLNIPAYINFSPNSLELNKESQERIWFIANQLENFPELKLIIVGSKIDQENKIDIVRNRCNLIFDSFIESGVNPQQLVIEKDQIILEHAMLLKESKVFLLFSFSD